MQVCYRQFLQLLSGILLAAFTCSQTIAADATDAAVDRSNEINQAMANHQDQVADLESQFGPYHRSLLEPLNSMTELAESMEDFELVADLQNRQLQVIRTVLGFRHPDIKPLLRNMIRNQMRLQNWEEITDYLEHLRYLAVSDEEDADIEPLLEAMEHQAYWYLARVYLDGRDRAARNFMDSRRLYDDILDLAEDHYGEDSPLLVPWMYRQAMSEYRMVELLNSEDGTAADTIDRLVREEGSARLQLYTRGGTSLFGTNLHIPVVEKGDLVGEDYLRDSMQIANRIADIAEEQGDLEAQGMALIYNGDFQKVMGRGTAFRKYREARELLLEAGIPEQKIEQYFNQPMVIPVPELFLRLDEAIAYQQAKLGVIENRDPEVIYLAPFVAWDESLPDVPKPYHEDTLFGLDLMYNQVDLKINISSSGNVSRVDVLSAEPAGRSIEREAYRSIRDIQIRPAIFEGKAKRSREVHIKYLFLAEE